MISQVIQSYKQSQPKQAQYQIIITEKKKKRGTVFLKKKLNNKKQLKRSELETQSHKSVYKINILSSILYTKYRIAIFSLSIIFEA